MSPPKRGLFGGLLGTALVAGAVFAPVTTFGFAYDDHWTVENARVFTRGLAPLLRVLLGGHGVAQRIPDATRPAMVTSVWVDHRLFGLDPSGYHLHSLLLYCLATALATLAVFAVTRKLDAAVAGGAIFAVAPAHAEVVAAVNYREDLLAAVAVFGVFAWLFAPRRRPELVDHAVLVAALCLLGLLGKESTVALVPIVAAGLVARRPVRAWGASRRASLASLAAVLALWGAWRASLVIRGADDVPRALAHRGVGERVLRAARYSVRATLDGVLPLRWSPDYAPEPAASAGWLALLLALVAGIVWLARQRRGRVMAAGLAIALVAALPTSPLVSPVNERADRYVFLGTLGGAIVWGTFLARAARWVPVKLRILALGVLLLPVAVVARQAAAPWRSDGSLWRAAAERAPASSRAWAGLSRILRLEGDLSGADLAVERAVALDPAFLRARVTRLYNRLARGDVTAARAEIAEIQRRGGGAQVGMTRALACVDLPPAAIPLCIDPRDPSEAPGGHGP